jgi:hypothetical protein
VGYPDNTLVGYAYDFADRPYSAQKITTLGPAAVRFAAATTRHALVVNGFLTAIPIGDRPVPHPLLGPGHGLDAGIDFCWTKKIRCWNPGCGASIGGPPF